MNYNEQHEMLIEYAEGSLPAERRAEVETMLSRSPELRRELELIRSAFVGLQYVSVEKVPDHYFTNFLPRLRQKIDSGEARSLWNIPRLIQTLMVPAAVIAIIVSIITVYLSFEPEQIQSPVYPLVSQLEQNELNAIVDERSNFEPAIGIINGTDASIVIDDPDIDVVYVKLNEELLSDDYATYHSESELVSQMDDLEIEQLLERMMKPAIL